MTAPALELVGISKAFAGVRAADGVSFDVRPGEVHALLGENGAGKSTLMKILSGIYEPTSGELPLGDQVHAQLTPAISKAFGIRLIYQELSVIDHLSIEENLFVGSLPTRRRLGVPVVDQALIRRKALRAMERVGLKRDPAMLVGARSISEKQQVEIAKALSHQSRVLIMDEPTAALNNAEIEELFRIIRQLRSEGVGIVYISHKMDELQQIADRVTVMRDGQTIEVDARYIVAVNDAGALLDAGLAGLGIVRLPRFMADPHLASGDLVALLQDWQTEPTSLYVAFPPSRHLSAKLRVFVDWVAETVAVHAP